MLCVLLVTFPPSKDFETYLRSFIQQHTTHQESRVDVVAKHCLRRLAIITKKGPRGKPPSTAEIETASVSGSTVVIVRSDLIPSLGRCLQPFDVRRITRCHHPITRAQLPAPKSPYHPSLPCRRYARSRWHKIGRYIPCPRGWGLYLRTQSTHRSRILHP